jgi:hypothetical protein
MRRPIMTARQRERVTAVMFAKFHHRPMTPEQRRNLPLVIAIGFVVLCLLVLAMNGLAEYVGDIWAYRIVVGALIFVIFAAMIVHQRERRSK